MNKEELIKILDNAFSNSEDFDWNAENTYTMLEYVLTAIRNADEVNRRGEAGEYNIVKSVNGKIGAVELDAEDVGAYAPGTPELHAPEITFNHIEGDEAVINDTIRSSYIINNANIDTTNLTALGQINCNNLSANSDVRARDVISTRNVYTTRLTANEKISTQNLTVTGIVEGVLQSLGQLSAPPSSVANDLNNLYTFGAYAIQTPGWQHAPVSNFNGIIEVFSSDGHGMIGPMNTIGQRAYTKDLKIYVRYYRVVDTVWTWSDWQKLITSEDVATNSTVGLMKPDTDSFDMSNGTLICKSYDIPQSIPSNTTVITKYTLDGVLRSLATNSQNKVYVISPLESVEGAQRVVLEKLYTDHNIVNRLKLDGKYTSSSSITSGTQIFMLASDIRPDTVQVFPAVIGNGPYNQAYIKFDTDGVVTLEGTNLPANSPLEIHVYMTLNSGV